VTLRVPDGTLGGQTVKKAAVSGFILTESSYSPTLEVPWHEHEQASVCFILHGSFTESFDRSTQSCGRFDLTFKPAGLSHRDEYGHIGATSLVIEMAPDRVAQLESAMPLFREPIHFGDAALAGFGMRVYREFLAGDAASRLGVEAAVLELVVELHRVRRIQRAVLEPSWLGRVREILEDCWSEDMSLARLATVAGVHPVHLAQVFRRRFGCPIGDYVRRIRVRRAREQMLDGDRPLAQVAVACGFYDQSHFTKAFKRYMGITPAEFRGQRPPRRARSSRPSVPVTRPSRFTSSPAQRT